ncbi:MAG TPA: ATPase, T2SS/T4P/T4SS family [Reyranella sp.]|nr:ATPase, T2SS/T4P/T4SS family [Reyranella sp.]
MLRPLLPAQTFSTPEPEPALADSAPTAAAVEPAPTPPAASLEARHAEPRQAELKPASWEQQPPQARADADKANGRLSRSKIDQARRIIQPMIMSRIDLAAAVSLPRKELVRQLEGLVAELLAEHRVQLNRPEQEDLVYQIVNDMMGLGPLEPLLEDDGVTDIMINGPKQIYIEKRGKLELTSVTFEDNAHLLNICNRIVSRIGRRVDESSPICDARLLDGSRVNIIIPPLAIDGASVSIRKFGKRQIGFDQMAQQGNISAAMATVLRIAARCRLNIIISGGTGSGKTTMLNALSGMIENGERVVTIEDAAELRLQQPHVVRLETRPANLEGNGEVNMRDLVKNALRMRPDRIILGEVRGPEAIDLLQAMNTGHDGSMGTLHANRPREALTRLENMVTMGVASLPPKAIRTQIAGSLQMIVQISRMRDGIRRVTHITEVMGMEGEVVITQDLFTYEFKGEATDGKLVGAFKSSGLRPHFLPRAAYYGLDRVLMEAMG